MMPHLRLLSHFIVAGFLAGLVEIVGQGYHGPLHVLGAVTLSAVLALSIGLAILVVAIPATLAAARSPALRSRLSALKQRATEPSETPSRAYATTLVTMAMLITFGAGLHRALGITWRLQDMRFAIQLTTAFSIGLAFACLLGFSLLRGMCLELLSRWKRLPTRAVPVITIALGFPLMIGLVLFVAENKELLGDSLTKFSWLGIMAIATLSVASTSLFLLRANPRTIKRYVGAVTLVFGLSLITMLFSFKHYHSVHAIGSIRRSVGGDMGLAIFHRLSDVDRDGFSSLMGGRDCAPFDGEIYPGAIDLVGNGIDENCDGYDQGDVQVAALEPFLSVAPPVPVKRYNIVWLIIDSARADQMGVSDDKNRTSPHIDDLARDALVFERAYSQSSRTLYSLSSMFSGKNPMGIKWHRARGYPQADRRLTTLPASLTAAGYATKLVLPGNVEKYYTGLQQGFGNVSNSYLDDDWRKWSYESAPVANLHGLEFMEKAVSEDKPFFLAIHYIEPHVSYKTHGDSYPSFGDGPMATYRSEIAYVDRQIENVLNYLRYKSTLWNDTIVIVTADHGEEFGEHGGKHHGRTCHRESTHVPLVVRIPGVKPQRITVPVALIDIVPMLIELVGLPKIRQDVQGQSLLVSLLEPTRVRHDRPIFCATANKGTRTYLQTAVRSGNYLLVKEVWDGMHALYDTANDKGEEKDLSTQGESSQVLHRLEAQLKGASTEDIEAGW